MMFTDIRLSLVAAMGENNVIGSGNNLPSWSLADDMTRFVSLTKEHRVVIVGRKTHESIVEALGRPLAERITIVLSRQKDYRGHDCIVVSSWDEALSEAAKHGERAIVIGGEQIYRLALPYDQTMFLTHVHGTFEGDAHFPRFDMDKWELLEQEKLSADANNSHDCTYVTLVRKQFVNMANARTQEQREVMTDIEQEGVCPFCPENLSRFHKKPILKKGLYWVLTHNQWPYENTRVHLLAIAQDHAEKLSDLPPEAGQELLEIMQWAEQEFQIEGGGLGMRFGSTAINGASVSHLHAQLLSADVTDKNDPDYKKVCLRIG